MARGPKPIANILSELMVRQGYTRVQSAGRYASAWREAAGPLAAEHTGVGALRRGVLEVIVANSTLMQELTFQKPTLLEALTETLPSEGIEDLRFRLGTPP